MKSRNLQTTTKGLLAITTLAAIYGLTAVLARFLSHGVGLFEQWYLRYAIGFLGAVILFRRQISWWKFLHLPRREWAVLIFRVIVGQVLAVSLYTLASEKAKIGPVAFMQVLPSTSVLGVVLFREKISWQRSALILASFAGAAIVAVNNLHDLSGFNVGEMYSLVSGILFGLFFVTRKWHSDALNNYELTAAVTGCGLIADYAISLALYHRPFIPLAHWSAPFTIVLIAAGLLATIIQFLLNYGFQHVSAVVAGNILSLEQVFGALFGFVFYGELLTPRQITGGLVILASVILMNQVARREHQTVRAAAGPD